MGSLTLPSSGSVYVDANTVIYSVEHIAPYFVLLAPLWATMGAVSFDVVSSELTLLEVLVRPLRTGNTRLEREFRRVLSSTADIRLVPITQKILEDAAQLRATTNLKTPDAIHAATALREGCALFVTNDVAFRHVSGLPVVVLRDLVGSP